jgi:hypothetical protein
MEGFDPRVNKAEPQHPNAWKAVGLLGREQRRTNEHPNANEYDHAECLTDHGTDSPYTLPWQLLEGLLQMLDRASEDPILTINGAQRRWRLRNIEPLISSVFLALYNVNSIDNDGAARLMSSSARGRHAFLTSCET